MRRLRSRGCKGTKEHKGFMFDYHELFFAFFASLRQMII